MLFLVANLLGYFLLKGCFTGVTETLALRRIIFNSMGIFILNCLLLIALVIFSVSLSHYLEYWCKISELEIIIIWFMMAVILFISRCVLVRIVVKRIFGKMDKNHQNI